MAYVRVLVLYEYTLIESIFHAWAAGWARKFLGFVAWGKLLVENMRMARNARVIWAMVLVGALLPMSRVAHSGGPQFLRIDCLGREAPPAAESSPAPKQHFFCRSSDDLARAWGFAAVADLEVAPDDIEIRVWHGGGLTGDSGFILQRRSGQWAAFHLGPTDTKSMTTAMHGYRAARIQPYCAFEDILQALREEQIFDLKPARAPPVCRETDNGEECFERMVADGWSVRIQTRRGDQINDNVYDNPSADEPGLPADMVRATRILHIAVQALTGQPEIIYEPHSKPVPVPGIVLVRVKGQYVSAFYVKTYEARPSGGRIEFDQRYFSETDQRFRWKEYLDQPGQTLSWDGVIPPTLDRENRFNLKIIDGQLRAVLLPRPIYDEFQYEIAVPDVESLGDLASADLSGGFEARPIPGIWGYRVCERVRQLEPVVDGSRG